MRTFVLLFSPISFVTEFLIATEPCIFLSSFVLMICKVLVMSASAVTCPSMLLSTRAYSTCSLQHLSCIEVLWLLLLLDGALVWSPWPAIDGDMAEQSEGNESECS